MRVGVVGLGRMGRIFTELLRQIPSVQVVGALTSSRDKADAIGVRPYESLDELLDVVDALVIANPSGLHYTTALEALQRGVHVFTEKPLALSAQEAVHLTKLSRERGLRLAVGHMRRLDELYRFLPHKLTGKLVHYLGISRDPEPPPHGWLRDVNMSGGLIFDLGIHEVDLFLWLLRLTRSEELLDDLRALKVMVTGGLDEMRDVLSSDDLARCIIVYAGRRVRATIILDRYSPEGYETKYEVLTDREVVSAGWDRSGYEWFTERFRDVYEEELRNFISSVEGEEELFCMPEEAALAVALSEAALKAHKENRWVGLREVIDEKSLEELVRSVEEERA